MGSMAQEISLSKVNTRFQVCVKNIQYFCCRKLLFKECKFGTNSPAQKAFALLCFPRQPYSQLSLAILRCVVSPTKLLIFVTFALIEFITCRIFAAIKS